MKSFGQARCILWQQGQLGVRFNQIGRYELFLRLLDEFKREFHEREWHPDGWWLIPEARYQDFREFCNKHGIRTKLEQGWQMPLL